MRTLIQIIVVNIYNSPDCPELKICVCVHENNEILCKLPYSLINKLLAGHSKITIRDIARKAKVSPGTVDRVLHQRVGVSEKTRSNVLSIISELDYQPDILARTLASRKVIKLAAICPGRKNAGPFWQLPLDGMERAVNEIRHFGVTLHTFVFDHTQPGSFEKQSEKLLSVNPDGIIMVPLFTREAGLFSANCSRRGIPFIYINSDIPARENLSFIGQDARASGRVAASLLRNCVSVNEEVGIVNIAHHVDNQLHIVNREKGFREYFSEIAGTKGPRMASCSTIENNPARMKRDLAAFFNKHDNLKAVFVTNSRVYLLANWLSRNQTGKLFLAGYDMLPESLQYLREGVIDFLISQKPEEQGYRGVMSLFRHLVLKQEVPIKQYLPIDIITRENSVYY